LEGSQIHSQSFPAYALSEEVAERLAAARAGDQSEFERLTRPHRHELLTHCYRMLGSFQDAEDQVQETFLRAWRRLETYEGRAPFRAWLYKIATNACLDAMDRRPRRVLPQSLRPASDPNEPVLPPVLDPIWLEPFPDELLAPREIGPEARYEAHESITLAFLTALQALSPRQRAVLILCDVLGWSAGEAAELVETTIPAVNSLLHRARGKLGRLYTSPRPEKERLALPDEMIRRLLERYVQAWEAADVEGIVALLKEDATFPMPPLPMWYRGRESIRRFIAASSLAGEARGRWRLHPARANGCAAFGVYVFDADNQSYKPFAIQVLTLQDELLSDITTFGYPSLFPHFGLPLELK
jgi:RNA polymerase sigma-70 factor, ECF subfamily